MIPEIKKDTPPIIMDDRALVNILTSIMEKATGFVRQFDTQTNVIVGFSTGVFIFAVSMVQNKVFVEPLVILAFFSILSALVGLYAIHPPRFMRKKKQKESLMYNRKVASFSSHLEYSEELIKMLGNREKVIEEYALEIYNLYKYYYRPKRKLFNISRNLLIAGFSLSLIIYFYILIRF